MKNKKKQIIWFIVFILLIVLTLYTMTKQNKAFSMSGFISYVSKASWQWIILAFICMSGFVIFEGLALIIICRAFGYKRRVGRGLVYSIVDIYFSAITPSATGGQPASAYFMIKDKIPAAVTTIALIINLTLYTISIIVIGVVCFFTAPGIFMKFGIFSRILILMGCAVQFILILVFMLLVYKEKIITRIASIALKGLAKVHLVRHIDEKLVNLKIVEQQYKECVAAIKMHKKPLFYAFLCNLMQRVSLIMVSVCIYMAVGGSISAIHTVFVTQGYVVLGSNSVPIPGAVGVADYLFIDGFEHIVSEPLSIELLSRGISFYCCIAICGILTLIIYLLEGLKGIERKKT